MFHNNWVRGEYQKELRLKEMKMYALDVDREYSGVRQYLTVEMMNKGDAVM